MSMQPPPPGPQPRGQQQPGGQPSGTHPQAGQQPSMQPIPAPGRWFAPPQQFAAPQQFHAIPDAMLASQQSSRVATRAFIWACVAFVLSMIPFLNWFTLVPALPAIQIGIAARVQRLGGRSMAVWAIVLASLALLGSVVWTIVHFAWFVSLATGT